MKKPTQLAFLLFVVITILLCGCTPVSTPVPPTFTPEPTAISSIFTPEPTAISFVMPEGDFVMNWNIYSSEYNSSGGIVTIRRRGSNYTEKIVYPDGSNGIFELTVISVGSKIKLTGHLGITSSLYGDYMLIDSDGWLAFYDNQGYIYSVPPLN